MRDTGIQEIGSVPWGTHFCQFYATKEDLIDTLVPYFKAGLEGDECCMWVTSPLLGVEEAWEALGRQVPELESCRARDRIQIVPYSDWYLRGGSFEPRRVLEGWVDKLEDALGRGCAGLRLSGDTFWLKPSDWQSFADYEAAVDEVIGRYRMLALCTYSLERCGASEVADVIKNHEFALIRRAGEWEMFGSFSRRRIEQAHEAERERLTRLYAVLSRVNETIIRTRDEGRLYREVCRIVAEQAGFPLVWVGLVEERRIVPVARSGPAAAYLEKITVEVDGQLGQGPTGTSVREGRAVVNADFVTNRPLAPWRESALAHGFRASAAFPLRRQGKTVGALSLYADAPGAFDADQVKLLEALAADLSYALDSMAQDRLRAEAERALVESETRLREANQRKSEFLAVLSHELRNPLAPIANSLFILDRAPAGGEQESRAKAILTRQVGQLTRLVDDLLDVTRVASGKFRLQRTRFDLAQMVRRTAEDYRAMLSQVDFEVHAGLAPLWIDADEARVAQVIGNLLTNAAKFTQAGGKVTVALDGDLVAGTAVLRVRDTGTGISRDMLPQVFEPFTQAADSLDRSSGGLGLGLALVKGIVELHGGTVEARSGGLNTGSEFVVRLPAPAREIERERATRESSRPLPRRVLVIEDNEDAATSLRDALELGEHRVEVATSGPEGIAKAVEFKPEVVLCDIGLPGMDGYEVARALRADAVLGRAHLVALTGYALPEDQGRARAAGFDQHLPKPPSLEAIENLLASLPPPPAE
jgi:two-component system CheB/CheR fusion protein